MSEDVENAKDKDNSSSSRFSMSSRICSASPFALFRYMQKAKSPDNVTHADKDLNKNDVIKITNSGSQIEKKETINSSSPKLSSKCDEIFESMQSSGSSNFAYSSAPSSPTVVEECVLSFDYPDDTHATLENNMKTINGTALPTDVTLLNNEYNMGNNLDKKSKTIINQHKSKTYGEDIKKCDSQSKFHEDMKTESDSSTFGDSSPSNLSDESGKSSESVFTTNNTKRNIRKLKDSRSSEGHVRKSSGNLLPNKNKAFNQNLVKEIPSTHSTPIKHSNSLELHNQANNLKLRSCPSTPVSPRASLSRRNRNGSDRYRPLSKEYSESDRGSGIKALSILCQYYKELVTALKEENVRLANLVRNSSFLSLKHSYRGASAPGSIRIKRRKRISSDNLDIRNDNDNLDIKMAFNGNQLQPEHSEPQIVQDQPSPPIVVERESSKSPSRKLRLSFSFTNSPKKSLIGKSKWKSDKSNTSNINNQDQNGNLSKPELEATPNINVKLKGKSGTENLVNSKHNSGNLPNFTNSIANLANSINCSADFANSTNINVNAKNASAEDNTILDSQNILISNIRQSGVFNDVIDNRSINRLSSATDTSTESESINQSEIISDLEKKIEEMLQLEPVDIILKENTIFPNFDKESLKRYIKGKNNSNNEGFYIHTVKRRDTLACDCCDSYNSSEESSAILGSPINFARQRSNNRQQKNYPRDHSSGSDSCQYLMLAQAAHVETDKLRELVHMLNNRLTELSSKNIEIESQLKTEQLKNSTLQFDLEKLYKEGGDKSVYENSKTSVSNTNKLNNNERIILENEISSNSRCRWGSLNREENYKNKFEMARDETELLRQHIDILLRMRQEDLKIYETTIDKMKTNINKTSKW